MKGVLPKTILLLGMISLILGNIVSYGKSISHAEDLVLVGKETGLEIIPESARLFDLTNLNPGDTYEANLIIENKHIAPFELFMRTEQMSEVPREGEADLFKQLLLTVYLGDSQVYSGNMIDFATTNISLGSFSRNDTKTFRAVVHLPGLETGNEFQGKTLDVKWIFIAQADKEKPEDRPKPDSEDDVLPKTRDTTPMGFYLVGGLLSGIGIIINRKKRT
ncbi:MAG: LPXTG cell wall anchor domain-containing protein [Caldicoprobacterales bacterium]